ncbi:MAG TPA: hypothetical protein PLB02_12850, partial [Thermoanaerobaculia bacterium]|nr:hypothetical protein [Thermoanaerobaculia bacterium]
RSVIRGCTDRNQASFQQYGARGIKVCPEWMESFDQFLLDMGPAPSPKHLLGRLDVTKGYYPATCCWTTRAEQALRRQGVRKVGDGDDDPRGHAGGRTLRRRLRLLVVREAGYREEERREKGGDPDGGASAK